MKLYFVSEELGQALACFEDPKELEEWIIKNTYYRGDLEKPIGYTDEGEPIFVGGYHLKSNGTPLEITPLNVGQPVYDFIWKEYGIQSGDYLSAFDKLLDLDSDVEERLSKAGFNNNEDYAREYGD